MAPSKKPLMVSVAQKVPNSRKRTVTWQRPTPPHQPRASPTSSANSSSPTSTLTTLLSANSYHTASSTLTACTPKTLPRTLISLPLSRPRLLCSGSREMRPVSRSRRSSTRVRLFPLQMKEAVWMRRIRFLGTRNISVRHCGRRRFTIDLLILPSTLAMTSALE